MEEKSGIVSENLTDKLLKIYPKRNTEEVLKILSIAPTVTTVRVNTLKVNLLEAIEIIQTYLAAKYKGVFSVTVHPLLDDVLLITPVDRTKHTTRHTKEVIVDVYCGSAVLRGAHVFAPGVLAAPADMNVGDRVSVYADLEMQCRRGFIKPFHGNKFFVGNGISQVNRNSIFRQNANLRGVAIEIKCSTQPSFTDLNVNLFFPQNLPSTVVGHVLNPHSNDVILDMCASPGGKTTHIATLMKNKGTVVAIDKSEKKVLRIHENAKKLGLSNIECFAYDSTKLCSNDKEGANNSPPFQEERFGCILLDPPCSGFGQRPQLRCVMKDKEVQSYPIYQRKLFHQAVKLLKPGGRLVYSTCTLLAEENEQQVAWAIETFPNLSLITSDVRMGGKGVSGYGLSHQDCEKVQRFDQCFSIENSIENDTKLSKHDDDTIAFFIACFQKKA